MGFDIILAWSMFTFIAVVLPGPDFVYISSISLKKRSYGICAGIGVQTGIAVHVLLTYIGAITFFTTYPLVFRGVQILGAFFLIYLAVNILRSSITEYLHLKKLKNGGEDSDLSIYKLDKKEELSNWGCCTKGFLVNILNPKAFIFIVSTLPQFLRADIAMPIGEQFVILGALSVFIGLAWWFCLAVMVNFISKRFATPSFRVKVELFSGSVILVLAILLVIRVAYVLYIGDTSLV
ncbi:hypothetical protein CKF54_02470 [Psittacicella hinzii]|uniref:Uncharacterized protein n=1 Tax=Psittacicella hinzii TaxID=2028575 RepID=A0A3A1Y5R1_9GAMM|nr:LysE family translocator [Psittacicella hinzii]RIY33603.1 hypothetical protein CKF54_02470 [Psittacicella hinzii]